MSAQIREHEEFCMSLETAFKEAKIDIVGGRQYFFNTFSKSLSLGKAINGLSTKSSVVSGILEKVMKKLDSNK